jgi:hypothetical protein
MCYFCMNKVFDCINGVINAGKYFQVVQSEQVLNKPLHLNLFL